MYTVQHTDRRLVQRRWDYSYTVCGARPIIHVHVAQAFCVMYMCILSLHRCKTISSWTVHPAYTRVYDYFVFMEGQLHVHVHVNMSVCHYNVAKEYTYTCILHCSGLLLKLIVVRMTIARRTVSWVGVHLSLQQPVQGRRCPPLCRLHVQDRMVTTRQYTYMYM